MDSDLTPSRSDALARASALAARARELRKAQVEVQDLTAHEVQVLARTAASFFDSIPLPEFTTTLLPQSARNLRRIRHRILHRTIHTTVTGTLIRALLLGRDGVLRLFSARSADSRDLLLILEPGRTLPVSVMRDVVDWTPMLRVPGFRPFEILEKLSGSLDAVEEQIADAEHRVLVQKAALESGDLSALIPARTEGAAPAAVAKALPSGPAATAPTVTSARVVAAAAAVPPLSAVPSIANSSMPTRSPTPVVVTPSRPASPSPTAATQAATTARNPFDVFDAVEKVAATVESKAAASPMPRYDFADEPDEWDDPVEPPAPRPTVAPRNALFPVLPPPR
ncbi:MAG: hypothetical protein V4813_18015 [Gemmatimonadota bacterium]